MNTYNSPTTKPIFRASQVVWYVLTVVEALLVVRLFLKLFGANQIADFTNFIYSVTASLVAPFVAVFKVTYIDGAVFEWTTLLAIAMYWLVAVGVMQLLLMSRSVSTVEAAKELGKREGAL